MKPSLKYLFEVLAIVVGITLSFMVDEWREERQNRKITKENLIAIKSDLSEDSISFGEFLSRYELTISLLEKIYYTEDLDFLEVNNFDAVQYLYSTSGTYSINRNSYDGFINAVDIPVIKYPRLLSELSNYYNNTEFSERNRRMREMSIRFVENHFSNIPYLGFLADDKELDEGQVNNLRSVIQKEFTSDQFRSAITNLRVMSIAVRRDYITKQDHAGDLIDLITKETSSM